MLNSIARRTFVARWTWFGFLLGCLFIGASGCSIKKMGVNKLGDALAGGGTAFTSDDDPELVKAAVPFSLKLMESLLNESPRHRGLLFATASGFTQYAYAFVQQDADELEDKDLEAATAMRARAKRLFIRARNYGLRGLSLRQPDFEKALRTNPKSAVRFTKKVDVPLLYWTAASWAAAISLSKDNPQLVSEQPIIEALIDRALELDESFSHGAIHSFLITYEMSRQGAAGDPVARAKRHLDRALELSGGNEASPLIAYAETVSVGRQNVKEFDALLQRALAIDADAHPESKLVNLVMQRRARWLVTQREKLFLVTEK
ncbi:MAG: hypothetical protein HY043_23380 [Verrucomicrobia bacterium]|nr:hypothetical protein [Verrucomicrobiota bacterium]